MNQYRTGSPVKRRGRADVPATSSSPASTTQHFRCACILHTSRRKSMLLPSSTHTFAKLRSAITRTCCLPRIRGRNDESSGHDAIILTIPHPHQNAMTNMTSEQHFIPLNDIREMKRSSSRGSSCDVELEHEGMHDTTEYRLQAFCPTGSRKISLWHDVSLVHIDPKTREETPYLNFVCEIPKFTRYVVVLKEWV